MRFAVVADPIFLAHRTPNGHPERPQRLAALMTAVDSLKNDQLVRLPARKADWAWIEKVHSARHVEAVRASASRRFTQFDADTWGGPESCETALHAAGSCIQLVELLTSGQIDAGFAMVRPPGHHAERDRAMGFCLINNIAVCAERALALPHINRVAIIDYDVHHGNGTQDIFENRCDALYISIHQHPLYPGTGLSGERGVAAGEGFTVNFPAPPGMGNHFYAAWMDELVAPILAQYRPDLILASAGFDAHREDPLASMELDAAGFGEIAARLNKIAAQVCAGKILYVLEGGYNLSALAESVVRTIQTSLDGDSPREMRDDSELGLEWRRRAIAALAGGWKIA